MYGGKTGDTLKRFKEHKCSSSHLGSKGEMRGTFFLAVQAQYANALEQDVHAKLCELGFPYPTVNTENHAVFHLSIQQNSLPLIHEALMQAGNAYPVPNAAPTVESPPLTSSSDEDRRSQSQQEQDNVASLNQQPIPT
ncbi:hypothetical protein L914_13568 [Phytophthora nicotianae]|uniref:GIY-YIG domain-containing protein n=2 Tax=Phytophthora nicotianae TaxID=4792 RepID=V9EPR0_PHYNI|nr:hypothetical protein F443_14138 [Phytophthora nicotianae P1569]ETM40506.1 hypothetical protein L914_13568 [Phytophthora nicotianae]